MSNSKTTTAIEISKYSNIKPSFLVNSENFSDESDISINGMRYCSLLDISSYYKSETGNHFYQEIGLQNLKNMDLEMISNQEYFKDEVLDENEHSILSKKNSDSSLKELFGYSKGTYSAYIMLEDEIKNRQNLNLKDKYFSADNWIKRKSLTSVSTKVDSCRSFDVLSLNYNDFKFKFQDINNRFINTCKLINKEVIIFVNCAEKIFNTSKTILSLFVDKIIKESLILIVKVKDILKSINLKFFNDKKTINENNKCNKKVNNNKAKKQKNSSKKISKEDNTDQFALGNKRILSIFNKIAEKVVSIHKRKLSNNNINFDQSNSYSYEFNEIKERFSVFEFISRLSFLVSNNKELHSTLALITFDNFLKTNPSFILTDDNIYSTLFACFTISTKANSDNYIDSDILSNLTFESAENIYHFEMDFINRLNYLSVISEERYFSYKEMLYANVSKGIL